MSSIGTFSWPSHILQDAWAAMLEDQAWMDNFMTRKALRMAEHYQFATSFLTRRRIPFYEMNAGVYLGRPSTPICPRKVRL
ncbi:hypothetical protein K4F52_000965 [Lecanicillium sp. MT-2017a]|nr:hypothetical protein K4F52_000965 [Lecanicillium sp. MT-2017a]